MHVSISHMIFPYKFKSKQYKVGKLSQTFSTEKADDSGNEVLKYLLFPVVYNNPDTQMITLAFSGMNYKQNKGYKINYIFNHNISHSPGLRS